MKKLFIHYPLFRLLSPFFTGTLVYLLILLINNNVEQVLNTFLGQELYICIGISFIIQECARLSLMFFDRYNNLKQWYSIPLQLIITIIFSILIVTLVMYIYFEWNLGYSPNLRELIIFNSIFGFITVIYFLLYKGHELLYRINVKRLSIEEAAIENQNIEFLEYTSKINTDLLFDSLENLLIVLREDPEKAESFTDQFSNYYRYVLENRKQELISLQQELQVADNLMAIYSNLPFRTLRIKQLGETNAFVVPGAILSVLEQIVRTTIPHNAEDLVVSIQSDETKIVLRYQPDEKLTQTFDLKKLESVVYKYSIYSDQVIQFLKQDGNYQIHIPKLQIDENSYS